MRCQPRARSVAQERPEEQGAAPEGDEVEDGQETQPVGDLGERSAREQITGRHHPAQQGKRIEQGPKRPCVIRHQLIIEAERLANADERRTIQKAWGRSDATEQDVSAATAALVSSGARRTIEDRQAALCTSALTFVQHAAIVPAVRPVLTGIVDALKVAP